MSAIITIPGENLIALCQGQGRQLNIDKMIFANVPDIDPEATIDRSEQKPASELIVHESTIPDEYKAYVNPNQVVYSTVLDSSTGNYEFNWIGLYCSEEDVVVAITTLPKISKWKTEGQVQGNHLTRNFMLEFTGASECTGMSVTADTWQLDFSARLNSIDERERLSSRDTYGRARFWKDGYKVMHTDSGFVLSAGVGYVEGIRIDLEENLPISGDTLPKSVWLDVSYKLQGSNVIAIATPVYGDTFTDYTKDAINHYVVKLAEISEVGSITDFRTMDNIESDLVKYLKKQVTDHNLDLDAHSELLSKLATGIPEILSPVNESTEIGETPVFLCSEFVPVFVNTTMTASQWQIDFDSEDFSSPIYDSGSTSSALTSLELPAGYLQVSTLYKARCRRRLNTGQWSPWSDVVSFTTRDVFNYVKRPVNVAPADGATSVPEKPILKSGPFSIVGDMTDTLEATQFRIRKGVNILHISPEIAGSMEYVLPAGLLVVFSDYTLECRQKGTELGWSDWSTPTSFRTATAFITGDEAVYPNSWVGHDNATVAGLALDDGAELRSNGTDQEEDEGDWVQYSVRAKVRGAELPILKNSTSTDLVTRKKITQNEHLITDLGTVTAGTVTVVGDQQNGILWDFSSPDYKTGSGDGGTVIQKTLSQSKGSEPQLINEWRILNAETGGLTTNEGSIDENVIHTYDKKSTGWTLAFNFKISDLTKDNFYLQRHLDFYISLSKKTDDNTYQLNILDLLVHYGKGTIMGNVAAFGSIPINSSIWVVVWSNGNKSWVGYIVGENPPASLNDFPSSQVKECPFSGVRNGVSGYDHRAWMSTSNGAVCSFNGAVRYIGLCAGAIENLPDLFFEYHTDISSANFVRSPEKAHNISKLTAATGPAGEPFTSTDFIEIPTDSVSLGTDADPDNPNYVLLESAKQTPAESFRRVALGVKTLAKDSECRVTETQIDMWKKAATEDDNILSPTSWEIHDKASVEGFALEDNAVLGSNGIDQIVGGEDWDKFSIQAKVRDVGLPVLAGTSATELITNKKIATKDKLCLDVGGNIEIIEARSVTTQASNKLYFLPTNTLVEYDITTGESVNKVAPVTADSSSYNSIINADNDTLLIASGYQTPKLHKYTISTNQLVELATPPFIGYFSIGMINADNFVIFGGHTSPQHCRYTLSSNSYGNVVPSSSSGIARSAYNVNGKFYFLPAKSLIEYDIATDKFTDKISAITADDSAYNSIITIDSNTLLIASGYQTPKLHKYTISTNQLVELATPPFIGYFSIGMIDADNFVIFGGHTSPQHCRYTLSSNSYGNVVSSSSSGIARSAYNLENFAIDISSGNFQEPPSKVHQLPKLTAATGPVGEPFTSTDFIEIPTASVSLGTDADPDNPNYVLLESAKQTPAESFRRVALGVKALAKDSECRVTETQIDMWKKAATEDDNILSPTSWEIHDKASVEGLALEDNAVLGSNGIDQIVGADDWDEFSIQAKVRDPFEFKVDAETTAETLILTANMPSLLYNGSKLFVNNGNNGVELIEIEAGTVVETIEKAGGPLIYPFGGENISASTYMKAIYNNPFHGAPIKTGDYALFQDGTWGHTFGTPQLIYGLDQVYTTNTAYPQPKVLVNGVWQDIACTYKLSDDETRMIGTFDKPVLCSGIKVGQQHLARDVYILAAAVVKYTCTNLSPILSTAPDRALSHLSMTSATGPAGTTFTSAAFKEIEVESATFGADSDPVNPNYLTLKSTTQTPTEPFRRVALGLDGLAKDSECRVAETQIEVKKKVSIPDTDGAVAPTSWEIHESASTEGVALEDGAVLGSNGMDQGSDETDWTEYSVTAKVRDEGLKILGGTTAALLKTSSRVMEGENIITEIGATTIGEVTVDTNTIATNDPNPFGDGSGLALYQFNGNGKNLVGGNDFTSGLNFTNDSKFGQAVNATPTNTINIPVSMKNCTLSWWSKMGIAQSEFSWIRLGWHTGGICGPSPSTGGFLFYSSDMGIKSGLNYTQYNDGEYHHICVVFSNSGNKAYIDGSVFATYESSSPDQSYIEGLGYGDSGRSMNYDQFRIFNRALTLQEVQELFKEKIRIYSADISSGDFPSAPTKAHKMPALTSARGTSETAFTADSFTELPIETATIGKDSDAEHPDYILLKSEKQVPKESFRRIALGVKDLAKDSECRVAETQIDTWKQGA